MTTLIPAGIRYYNILIIIVITIIYCSYVYFYAHIGGFERS